MRLQENKQRLILLGEKVTDVWLADKITACIQQIEKIVSALAHSFLQPVPPMANIG